MPKHKGLRHRRAWWQVKHEYKHRWAAFRRDVAFDWRWFWADVADWKEERKNEKSI